ncbi:hypothetical protein [Polycladidibacter hongkongensis]|uniref:hypothetical protein n=1 Tax=Polycladidibacter hongkongensis TaxID=1647556 RepID=UPI00082E0016|nr:hypothetical protein [Pseudovibrio hongkongensis]
MTSKSLFKQRDIERAVKGAEKGGLAVKTIEIKSDGTIRLSSDASENSNDNKPLPKVASI